MAYKEEFANLDQYLEETTEKYPIVGTPIEAVENVKANGYATPYYFISPAGEVFDVVYSEYINNPDITGIEIKEFFSENPFEPRYLIFGIKLYMEEKNSEPDQEILDSIASDIESMENLPRGEYNIILNDNYIDKRRGIGEKDNSIERAHLNAIMKE